VLDAGYTTDRESRSPPERFHVFMSYTTREDEVQIVKPIVDRFLNHVLGPIIEQTLGEPPAFYDGYFLYNPSGAKYASLTLERAIRFGIEESEVLVAFVSPHYFGSQWCIFEWTTMASKKLRPWFDLCRRPPIQELRDQRATSRKPRPWECVRARVMMSLWRWRNEPLRPGGAIVPVLWKGDAELYMTAREMKGLQSFDWTSCICAVEAFSRVNSHLFRHGSVSPSWEWEAEALDKICQESMIATAAAIVEILRQRRLEYALQQ